MKTQETTFRYLLEGRNSGEWERIGHCDTKEQAENWAKEMSFLYIHRRIVEVK